MAKDKPTEDFNGRLLERFRLLFVVGKGGVGKTTVAATLATYLSEHDLRVLLVEVEGKPDLGSMLVPTGEGEVSLGANPMSFGGNLSVCSVSPQVALEQYLIEHGLNTLARTLSLTGLTEAIATSVPGIGDILVLGRIKAMLRSGDHDCLIVDLPASGHALKMLRAPSALANTISSGTIRRQADEVAEIFAESTTGVVIVTIAEETPISEAAETIEMLEESPGIPVASIVINLLVESVPKTPSDALTDFDGAERETIEAGLKFERTRVLRQNVQIKRLDQILAKRTNKTATQLPHVLLPYLPTTELRAEHIAQLRPHFAKTWGGR